MKRFILLLLSCFLCCASFASCANSEDAISSAYTGPEPSVEAEASPSPTPEPRTEVGIPEELKFCDEPLYYGMTIQEIREIFGQEDEIDENDFYSLNIAGKNTYYIYNDIQCQGRPVSIWFRIFNYDGVVYQKSYGLDAVLFRWQDCAENEQFNFMNGEIRSIIENLYGTPDYENGDKIPRFIMVWEGSMAHDSVTVETGQDIYYDEQGKPAEINYPQIKFESSDVELRDSIVFRDEAAMYKESGKQGVTLENLNRLREGMSFDQAEVLLGAYTAKGDKYTAGGSTYATFIWEDDGVWDAQIKITFCDGKIDSIYSKGL